MKKFLIAIVLIILVAGVAFFNLTKEKTPISAEDFKSSMESKGFVVQDVTSQFSMYDYVKQAYVALNPDSSYQIEFYQISDNTYATSFYNTNKSIFESNKESTAAETDINISNYSKYTLSSGGKYQVVSRIDNTAIYLDVSDTYRDDVKEILNEFGY